MTEVTTNGHLSIGEVLSLVQEDFPDVTISKIRFLESQGLIAPERTASGYRKFYDSDIDRLRWILRQQRDHFLPLKVIRKMLDQGVDNLDAPGAQPTLWAQPEDEAGDAAPGAGATSDGPGSDDPDADASYRSPSHPAVASAPPRPTPPATAAPAAPAAVTSGAGAPSGSDRAPSSDRASVRTDPSARPDPASTGAAVADATTDAAAGESRPAHSTPADVVAALQEDPRRAKRPRRGDGRKVPAPDEAATVDLTTGAGGAERPDPAADAPVEVERLHRDELCAAAGIDDDLLSGLEDYGLIVPTTLGGDPTYDGEALAIAKIASAYAAMGVEPRHLRMYKVAAEREAGFVEQLVFPLIKQRNPAARQQANDRSEDLIRLGEELHSALLRRQLGPVLGT